MRRLADWIEPVSAVAVMVSLAEFTFSTLPLSEHEALASYRLSVALRALFAAEYAARIGPPRAG